MPIKSADWIYSEDENGDVDTSTIDLISPEGGSAGMVRAEVDPVTGGIEVWANGRNQPYVGIADRHRMLNDQPYGITRAVRNPGKLVARFVASEVTIEAGSPTLVDHTGYDAAGDITGITSVTGQPNLLKVTPAATSTEGFRFTTFSASVVNTVLGGKIGIWLYVDNIRDYAPTETGPTFNLKVILTTHASGSAANALDITWTGNQVREGWNFLTFVMRDPLAYQTGTGVSEYNPFGIVATAYGTGVNGDFKNNPITKIQIQWSQGLNADFYLDSIWTDFETDPQVVFGCDAASSDFDQYVRPIFDAYGWAGYLAVPARVWSSGSKILNDFTETLTMVAVSKEIMQDAHSAGWDIINHTTNHLDMNALTSAAELAYEIKQVEALYAAFGTTRGNEFYASPVSGSSRLSENVIRNCGIKLQRHARKANVAITPWGIDNPHYVGASGLGPSTGASLAQVTSGVTASVTGLHLYSRMKDVCDVMLAYGATWFPFWHFITTVGDTGSGEDLTGDPLYITKSAFEKLCAYIRTKELAGELRVCKGITGLYYGIG